MHEDILKGRDSAEGLQKVAMLQKEGIINGRDDAGGCYKAEVWCMRKLQKGGMINDSMINDKE